jgi:putative transposase
MIHQVKGEAIRSYAVKVLGKHIELGVNGYRMDDEQAWDVLLKSASEYRSVYSVCGELRETVHHNTIREHLNERFDVCQLQADEIAQNKALAATVPQMIRGRAVEIAIDFHDEPSYAQDAEIRTYVCRSKAKAGTTRFFRVATAYVMQAGQRVTVAMRYVLPEYTKLDVLQTLLVRVHQCGVKIKCLYLDKGFCSTLIIRFLQDHTYKAIIACPIRGKTGGTQALCVGRKSYTTAYTFGDGTEAMLCCVRTIIRHQHDPQQVKWLLYVTINVKWPPLKVKKRYRRRFGIEASYRHMRQLRLFSTSRNPALRFFFYGLAFLLLNIWVLFCCKCLRHPGTHRIDKTLLPLTQFKAFIRRAVEQLRGVIDSIPIFLNPAVLKL